MTSPDGGSGEGGTRRPPEAYVEELKRLAANHVAKNVELAARVNALAKALASSTGSAPAMTPYEMLSKWLDFNLASYTALSSHSLALLDGIVAAAERALLPHGTRTGTARAASAPATATERVELKLSGRIGDRVVAPFMVENHYDRLLDVSFEASELVSANAVRLPGSCVAFEPAMVALAPKSEVVVQAAATLTRDWVVGETYRTTIRLIGYQAREVGLSITVLPSDQQVEVVTEPVRRTRAPKRRRGGGKKR